MLVLLDGHGGGESAADSARQLEMLRDCDLLLRLGECKTTGTGGIGNHQEREGDRS